MTVDVEPTSSPQTGARPAPAAVQPLVALIGNPNTGKTTLFNQLTGARARVGNYPGVTVERRVGRMRLGERRRIDVLDLPGTYSLSARSREEQIAIEEILGLHSGTPPDLVLVVVDAGQLIRNLYLVTQLVELDVPLVIALNMMDEVEGAAPSASAIEALFGVPCVPTTARSGDGIDALKDAIAKALDTKPRGRAAVAYPAELLEAATQVVAKLPKSWTREAEAPSDGIGRSLALALWALGSITDDDELDGIPDALRRTCLALHCASDADTDAQTITSRYAFLDAHAKELSGRSVDDAPDTELRVKRLTDRIDRIALHPVGGFAVFVLLMLVVFQALFSWSDPAIGVIEDAFSALSNTARTHLPPGIATDVLTEGLIAGVGNVVVFLPQILLLFLLLGILEDSGYMARAAYLMDRIMRSLGLHGRAFVPMLSGCACAIPAIMATRTMERERDRLLTMMVVPLMTCSARLPVYTLVIAALFPPSKAFGVLPVQGLLMVAMYLFATFVTLAAAGVLGRTLIKGRRMPLLLELPPYRLPTIKGLLRQMFDRAGVFLKEAGTVITVCTIGLWALLSYPTPTEPEPLPTLAVATAHQSVGLAIGTHTTPVPAIDELADNSAAVNAWNAAKMERSYGGQIGHAIEPAIAPLGFDWKIGVGLIGAFAAREVFVSTMGLVYGIGEVDEESPPLRDKIRAETHADGRPVYTPLMGLSLMVFFALACQCMSTLAVVRRETKSWRWPAFMFVYMSTLAWLMSFAVYQGGKLLGFA